MSFYQYTKRFIGALLFIFLLITPFFTLVNHYLSIPNQITTFKDETIFANKSISTINDNSIFTFDLPNSTEDEVIVKGVDKGKKAYTKVISREFYDNMHNDLKFDQLNLTDNIFNFSGKNRTDM